MQSSMGTLPNGESIFAPAPDSKPLYLQGVHELYTELKESEKKRGEKALQITRLQEKLSRCEEELGEFEAHLQRVRTEGAAAGLMAAPEKVPVQRRRNSFGSAVTRSAAAVSAVTRSASAATRSLSFTPRPKVGVSVGTPPPAAPRASSSALRHAPVPPHGTFSPAHSPAARRAEEPAARPAVHQGPTLCFDSPAARRAEEPAARPAVHQGPTLCFDSPPALRAEDPAAHRTALGECLGDANSPAKLRDAELAKAKCPPPDTQSRSDRRL